MRCRRCWGIGALRAAPFVGCDTATFDHEWCACETWREWVTCTACAGYGEIPLTADARARIALALAQSLRALAR